MIDILEHFFGHHVAYGLAVFEVVADEGGGESHQGRIHEMHVRVRAEVAAVVAGTGIDVKVVVLQNVLVVEPFREGLQVVLAHDEAEFALGVLFAQHLQGVARVGGLRERELDVAGPEAQVVADGEVHEMQTLSRYSAIIKCPTCIGLNEPKYKPVFFIVLFKKGAKITFPR